MDTPPSGYPIRRILRQIGIAQLAAGIMRLGLINNPISWSRNRREDMVAAAVGSRRMLRGRGMFESSLFSAF